MPKVGVVLSGCGVYDGAEIHESVLTLLALDRAGAEAVCIAPDLEQMHVVNHLTGQPVQGQTRNVLIEAARIARGSIQDLAEVRADQLDALIIPGGFGAAKNLSTFATEGADCMVLPEVAHLVKAMNATGKPIGFICIAPAMAAKIFQGAGPVTLTIGSDPQTAEVIKQLGQVHQTCPVSECVVDKKHKIVSTPAYMEAKSIAQAAEGIEKLVEAVLSLI